MSQMRNIYFSDEAFAILERPMYANGKLMRRSAKINRMILNKMEVIKNKQQHDIYSFRETLEFVEDLLMSIKFSYSIDEKFEKKIDIARTALQTEISRVKKI